MSEQSVARLIAAAEQRAKVVRETATTCVECGKSMMRWSGARTRHFSCDSDYPLAGTRCTCSTQCSGSHWGNGPKPCDPACVPCKRMAGRPLKKERR